MRTALDTAGRTVFFAGCTVIVALLGLVLLGLGSLQGGAGAELTGPPPARGRDRKPTRRRP